LTLGFCVAFVAHRALLGNSNQTPGSLPAMTNTTTTGFMNAISTVPGGASLAVGIYALLTLISTLGLWSFHVRLICIGQTTNELLRGTYKKRMNPYTNGCCSNFNAVVCKSGPER
jgi:hypothetical protein